MSPTEAGLTFASSIEPLLDELARARDSIAAASEQPRGTLRLTAPISFAQLNLVPLLPELARRYPELRVELILTDAIVDIVADRFDAAIRLGDLPDSDLVATRLCDMKYAACAGPEYLDRRGTPTKPGELQAHCCLRYPVPGVGARWLFRPIGGGKTVTVPIAPKITINNAIALRGAAVAGLGVALLPRWNIAADVAAGRLVRLFPDYQATASSFATAAWMLHPSRRYVPRKVSLLREFLREHFAHGAPAETVPSSLAPRSR